MSLRGKWDRFLLCRWRTLRTKELHFELFVWHIKRVKIYKIIFASSFSLYHYWGNCECEWLGKKKVLETNGDINVIKFWWQSCRCFHGQGSPVILRQPYITTTQDWWHHSYFLSLQAVFVVAEDATVSLTDLRCVKRNEITRDGKAWGWQDNYFWDQGVSKVSSSTLTSRVDWWNFIIVLIVHWRWNFPDKAPPKIFPVSGRQGGGKQGRYVSRAGLVSFSNRAPLLWNSLPVDVREAPSPSSFKRRLLNILKEPCNLNKLLNICFNNPSTVQ